MLESELVTRAMGGRTRVVGVLLTAGDATVAARLGARERGSGLAEETVRSGSPGQVARTAGPNRRR
ncbi:hypothetical protein [Nonomuraea sp. KM90]|uniref:hypothetical protein n=1 Tax=Nonomuraea sp. KM90 TaxID=3457428 RepID=UPI003FCDD8B1